MLKINCISFSVFFILIFSASILSAQKEFYQLKVYHIKTTEQEEKIDEFLAKAYLPALHEAGIAKVGVFKPIVSAEEKLIYVFIPFRSYKDLNKLSKKLANDKDYLIAGKNYLESIYTNPPYERIETILMNAFNGHPKFAMPQLSSPHKTRIYELRSYESYT